MMVCIFVQQFYMNQPLINELYIFLYYCTMQTMPRSTVCVYARDLFAAAHAYIIMPGNNTLLHMNIMLIHCCTYIYARALIYLVNCIIIFLHLTITYSIYLFIEITMEVFNFICNINIWPLNSLFPCTMMY